MPIYAYRCETCGHAKDVLQRTSDALLTVCPACGAQTFQKQLTSAGFQLKGSGWYVTDFKGGQNKPDGAGKGDAAKPDTATSDSKAGETKAEPTKGADAAAPVAKPEKATDTSAARSDSKGPAKTTGKASSTPPASSTGSGGVAS